MTDGKAVGPRRRKYAVLLALLLVALAVQTFSARGAERFISDVSASLLGVAIWFVVFECRWTVTCAARPKRQNRRDHIAS